MWFLCGYSGLSSWEISQAVSTYIPQFLGSPKFGIQTNSALIPHGLEFVNRPMAPSLSQMPETLARTVFKFTLLSLTLPLNSSRGDSNPYLWQESPFTPLCLFNFVFGHFDFVFVDIVFALRQGFVYPRLASNLLCS